jgi:hypothetical protein
MEDAYVIGIRLALDNGVSAGVAAIRDDLAKLDRAIAASTANLRQLQTVASSTTAAALGQAQPTRPPEQKPQSATETPAPPSVPQATHQITDAPQPIPLATRTSETAPAQHRAQTPSVQTEAAPRSIPMPHTTPLLTPKSEAASRELRIASPERVMVTAENPAQRSDQPAILPLSPSSVSAPPTAAPLTPSAASPRRQEAAQTVQTPSAALSISVSAPTPRDAATGELHNPLQPVRGIQSAPTPPPPTARPHVTQQPRIPSAPAKSIAAPMPSPSQAAPPVALPPAAPQSSSSTTGPTGGDVFLDGTRLGHWISTSLSRSAGRPPSGTTGFDPRLGVTWPGTQHGGG